VSTCVRPAYEAPRVDTDSGGNRLLRLSVSKSAPVGLLRSGWAACTRRNRMRYERWIRRFRRRRLHFNCECGQQQTGDVDGDGVGDRCDNCLLIVSAFRPTRRQRRVGGGFLDASWATTMDSDDDGVANDCDNILRATILYGATLTTAWALRQLSDRAPGVDPGTRNCSSYPPLRCSPPRQTLCVVCFTGFHCGSGQGPGIGSGLASPSPSP
jgi:hypothetical protein